MKVGESKSRVPCLSQNPKAATSFPAIEVGGSKRPSFPGQTESSISHLTSKVFIHILSEQSNKKVILKAPTHFFSLSLGYRNPYPPQGFSKNNSNKVLDLILRARRPGLPRENSATFPWCKVGSQYGTRGPCWSSGWSWEGFLRILLRCTKQMST